VSEPIIIALITACAGLIVALIQASKTRREAREKRDDELALMKLAVDEALARKAEKIDDVALVHAKHAIDGNDIAKLKKVYEEALAAKREANDEIRALYKAMRERLGG